MDVLKEAGAGLKHLVLLPDKTQLFCEKGACSRVVTGWGQFSNASGHSVKPAETWCLFRLASTARVASKL